MKKIFCILTACLCLAACKKEWTFGEELAVNSTRINLPQLEPTGNPDTESDDGFILTVYSNTDWTVSVSQGEDWINPLSSKGEKIGHVHVRFGDNLARQARIGKISLKSSKGKVIIVNLVQDGSEEQATSISDYLL